MMWSLLFVYVLMVITFPFWFFWFCHKEGLGTKYRFTELVIIFLFALLSPAAYPVTIVWYFLKRMSGSVDVKWFIEWLGEK